MTKGDLIQSILNSYQNSDGGISLQDVLIGVDAASKQHEVIH